MHLNQVVFIGILALSILLFNLIQKYIHVRKRRYRISNLIILKFLLRTSLLFLLALILYHEYNFENKSNKSLGKNLVFLIPESSKNEISADLRIQMNEIANSDFFESFGLARLSDDKIRLMKVIPNTSKEVFFSLLNSPNLELNGDQLQFSDGLNNQVNEYFDLFSNEFLISKSYLQTRKLNLLSSFYNNPAIKFYLLILSLILVSIDLVIKVKTVKL
jgi:hypothetical protein